MHARLRHCSVVALAVLATSTASADAPLPTRLEYRAPSSCPPASEFEKRLRSRAPRVRLVPGGAAPRTLYVEIVRRADGLLGTLRIVDAGGDRRRSLKAARCDDTVDGLALVAAVALDPESPMSGLAGDQPETPPTEPPPPPPPAATTRPEIPVPPSPPPTATPIVDQPDDARARREAGEPKQDAWHLIVGAGAGGLFGHAPGALPAFMFIAGSEWYVSPFWSPSIRVSLIQTGEREFVETGGTVQFRATMGMLELCPFRFGPAQLAFRPCVAGDAGVATISGTRTLDPQSYARWRWHLGASGLMALGVSKAINVTAAAGFLFPFRRDQVQFEPSVFFSDPAVSEFVRLDVTVAFP